MKIDNIKTIVFTTIDELNQNLRGVLVKTQTYFEE